jgi:hypothetical protein
VWGGETWQCERASDGSSRGTGKGFRVNEATSLRTFQLLKSSGIKVRNSLVISGMKNVDDVVVVPPLRRLTRRVVELISN